MARDSAKMAMSSFVMRRSKISEPIKRIAAAENNRQVFKFKFRISFLRRKNCNACG